jgi:hypothetical protein
MVRQLAHRILNVAVARTYVQYQDLENKAMLMGMLETPAHFIDHVRRYTASLTTQMTFGFRTISIEDPNFKEAFEVCILFYISCGIRKINLTLRSRSSIIAQK